MSAYAGDREFRTAFEETFLQAMQRGVMAYTYKGIPCLKCPLDLALYSKLIWEMKPRTLIEIGTFKGGSALWFADTISSYKMDTHIITIDVKHIPNDRDERVRYLWGDVFELGNTLTPELMATLARPMLIVEDSSHTYAGTLASLRFFDKEMTPGDVLIVEDGVLDDLGWSEKYGGGPNRALAEFFQECGDRFELMSDYCDYYGRNATYNPNGYLRRLK